MLYNNKLKLNASSSKKTVVKLLITQTRLCSSRHTVPNINHKEVEEEEEEDRKTE